MTKVLLADENFPLWVVKRLEEAGYDILSVALDCPGIDDRAVLNLACRTERRLLTFDADFGDLVFAQGMKPPKAILYFRLHPIILENVLAVALRGLIETPDGYFSVITQEATRLRQLPKTST